MRRIAALLGALVLGTTLSGCWVQAGYDAGRTYWNDGEAILTSDTIDEAVELWSYDLGDQPAVNLLSVAGKVFAADQTSASPKAVGLDAGTGDLLWTYAPAVDPSLPAVSSSNGVYLKGTIEFAVSQATFGGHIRISADTGEELSRNVVPSGYGNHTLAVIDGQVAVGGGGPHRAYPGQYFTWVVGRCPARFVDPQDGPRGGYAFAFVGTDLMWSYGTEARGYNDCATETGNWGSTWATELGGMPYAVAAAGDDRVVYVDDSGTMTLLDADTGAIQWATEVGTQAGRPAIVDGTIFLAPADNRLVAYSAASGTEMWSAPLAADGLAPTAAGDVVYTAVGTDIIAFATGGCGAPTCPTPLATLAVGSPVADVPIIDDGRLIVGTTDGRVVAFGLPG